MAMACRRSAEDNTEGAVVVVDVVPDDDTAVSAVSDVVDVTIFTVVTILAAVDRE